MRLSEKTLELNICAQVSAYFKGNQNLLWFGLTQKQEAKAGFDACVKLGGRLVIFQFKASNHVLKNGTRKFVAPHKQMTDLMQRAHSGRSIFYAFPMVGNTFELKANPDLLSQTWLLDVANIPKNIGLPTKNQTKLQKKNGVPPVLRRNECHNIYVEPNKVTIHSDPVEVPTERADIFFSDNIYGSDGIQHLFDGAEHFSDFVQKQLSGGARGLIIY